MRDTPRALLAFALITLILILWKPYAEWLNPPPEPSSDGPRDTADPSRADGRATQSPVPPPVDFSTLRDTQAAAPATRQQRWPELLDIIETPYYVATVSSRAGGHIQEFQLKEYPSGRPALLPEGEPAPNVQLIPPVTPRANLGLAYLDLDGDSVYVEDNFELLSGPALGLPKGLTTMRSNLYEGTLTLKYRFAFASGAAVTKTLTFSSDSYAIPISIQWERPELEMATNSFEITWPNGLLPTERLLKTDEVDGKAYVFQGGELEKDGPGSLPRQSFSGNTDWVAVTNKYFTAALIADQARPGLAGSYAAVSALLPGTGETMTRYQVAISYPARQPVEAILYLGPLAYPNLKALGVELERIINFGWIPPIGKAVLYSMVALHKVIPNYGLVLILFAFIVRIITNPLTKKSALSSQKMQLVQPQVKALQQKFKGNPQRLNQEMMALWKSEGVNPLGGCLPLLIQMPVLMAIFFVFRYTIELRGAPFILWMQNLSAPDVVFTLPFTIPLYGSGVTILAPIMGITMFIQQKISGAGANPQQKPMMYIMSGFFFLIFNQFPSGLNLYYAFSNVLAIFQQRTIRASLKAGSAATESVPDPKAATASPRKARVPRPARKRRRAKRR